MSVLVSILVLSSTYFCDRYVYALCLCYFETDHTASDKWVIKTVRQIKWDVLVFPLISETKCRYNVNFVVRKPAFVACQQHGHRPAYLHSLSNPLLFTLCAAE